MSSAAKLPEKKPYCFLDITIGGVSCTEKIYLELFHDKVPLTAGNFQALCDGHEGATVPGDDETKMSYKGSCFHRIINGFMIQGGDYTNHNGTGGYSIHGAEFPDESFDTVPLNKPGLLCMANRGPNTNGSQFFITCAPCSHLDGKHVVFGKVKAGMNTVRRMEHTATGAADVPLAPVKIADCGSLETLPDCLASGTDEFGDAYSDWPEDTEPGMSDSEKFNAGEAVRVFGNTAFGQRKFTEAIAKYEKALRYLDAVIPTSAISSDLTNKRFLCFSNLAQANLMMEKFSPAFDAANEAVKLDQTATGGKNTKALFRRATASIGMKDYESAKKDLTACLSLEPANEDIKNRHEFVLLQIKAEKDKEKKQYSKMFS